jgi:hypothetical protein
MEPLAAAVLFDSSDPSRLSREDVEHSHGGALAFFESLGLRPSVREDIDAALAASRELRAKQLDQLAIHRHEQQAQEAAQAGAPGTPIKCSDPDQAFPEPAPFTPPEPTPTSPLAAAHGGLTPPPPVAKRPPWRVPRWVKAGFALLVFYALVFGVWYYRFGGDQVIASHRKRRQLALNRALLDAAADNDARLVKSLLKQGADIHFEDRVYLPSGNFHAFSPLTRSVSRGAVEAVAVLLMHGADPNMHTEDKDAGMVPPLLLAAACKGEDEDAMKLSYSKQCAPILVKLLRAGADPNARYKSNRLAALHMVVEAGQVELALALLKAGADVNALTTLGNSALHTVHRLSVNLYGTRCVLALSRPRPRPRAQGASPSLEEDEERRTRVSMCMRANARGYAARRRYYWRAWHV